MLRRKDGFRVVSLSKFSQLICSRIWVRFPNSYILGLCIFHNTIGTQQEITPNLPALLVRILPSWALFLKTDSPEFLMSHHWASPSSQLGPFNCWQGLAPWTKPTWSDIWAFLLERQIVCATCPFIIKMRYLEDRKQFGFKSLLALWARANQQIEKHLPPLKIVQKCHHRAKIKLSQNGIFWLQIPIIMITLSASSGHTLLIHFQRKDFSKCRFYGFEFKCKYVSDVSGWVSSLAVFWQARGGVASGTREINSSLF